MEDKQKKQVIIMLLLLPLLGAVWYGVLFGMPFSTEQQHIETPEPENAAGDPLEAAEPGEGEILALVKKAQELLKPPRVQDPEPELEETERDIFIPTEAVQTPVTAEEPEGVRHAERLDLTAIIWSRDRAVAMINNRVVGVGDVINENWVIKEIHSQTVRLIPAGDRDAEEINLHLNPE